MFCSVGRACHLALLQGLGICNNHCLLCCTHGGSARTERQRKAGVWKRGSEGVCCTARAKSPPGDRALHENKWPGVSRCWLQPGHISDSHSCAATRRSAVLVLPARTCLTHPRTCCGVGCAGLKLSNSCKTSDTFLSPPRRRKLTAGMFGCVLKQPSVSFLFATFFSKTKRKERRSSCWNKRLGHAKTMGVSCGLFHTQPAPAWSCYPRSSRILRTVDSGPGHLRVCVEDSNVKSVSQPGRLDSAILRSWVKPCMPQLRQGLDGGPSKHKL